MASKAQTENGSGFFIWFDAHNKKEYYATPINHYFNKIVHIKNSKYRHIFYNPHFSIPKVTPKKNRATYNKHFIQTMLLDMDDPFEEQYGRFLINFLNCRLDTEYHAYEDFFCLYGYELLTHPQFRKRIKKALKIDYNSIDEFKNITNKYFDANQERLIALQNQFKNCVNYVYNLNGNEEDKKYDQITKFQAFALKENLVQYTEYIEVLYSTSSIFKNSFNQVKLSELSQLLNRDKINAQTSNKYSSLEISSILYIVLEEIVNNNISVKTCKNCGRYFIPLNRHAEVYCDLPPLKKDGKTCKQLGARTSYNKNINNVEGLLIYRRTYQKKLMELSRNPDATEKQKSAFDNWKKSAQAKIKDYKAGKLSEEMLTDWMLKHKDF